MICVLPDAFLNRGSGDGKGGQGKLTLNHNKCCCLYL